MKKEYLKIANIPAVLWGESSEKIFIAVHGNMSNKEDDVIKVFAKKAINKGYQVISFDLPEHGERRNEKTFCKVQNCVEELKLVIDYVKKKYQNISLFACSMGAYFSLLAYKDEKIKQSLFLSPVVDMERIINNMMTWFKVSEDDLREKQTIDTPIGQKLYWDYYCYVKENSVVKWDNNIDILYGAKDDISEREVVTKFAEKYNCGLKIMEGGEHYFHTDEQLEFFKDWLENVMI